MVTAYYLVDYDIPVEPHAKRRAFYRALQRLLREHELVADRSTQSVWILDRREIAEQIHNLAQRYSQQPLRGYDGQLTSHPTVWRLVQLFPFQDSLFKFGYALFQVFQVVG